MKLLVIRHGEAEPLRESDANRALTAKGISDAKALGNLISREELDCHVCVVSPYIRARQTLDNILLASPAKPEIFVAEHITPEDPVVSAYQVLSAFSDYPSIMIVSHLPLVSRFIASLVDGTEATSSQYPMQTASMAVLETDILTPGNAHLRLLLSPPYS